MAEDDTETEEKPDTTTVVLRDDDDPDKKGPSAAPAGGGRIMPDLVGGVTGAGPIDIGRLTGDLTQIQEQRAAANRDILARRTANMNASRQEMQKAYEATGIGPGELQPWNADQERAKHTTGPLEQFGSAASLFAVAAAAFTRQPAVNALNGMAAAMNSIQKRDKADYDQAFEAWKENTNLSVKRHAIMQQRYDNAIRLFDKDFQHGNAALEAAAVQFGDDTVLAMLRNGMHKEVFELIASRERMANAIQDRQVAAQKEVDKAHILAADPRMQSKDPRQRAAAISDAQRAVEGKFYPKTPLQEHLDREDEKRLAEGKERMSEEERNEAAKKFTAATSKTAVAAGRGGAAAQHQALFDNWVKEFTAKEGRTPSSQEQIAKNKEIAGSFKGDKPVNTMQALKARNIQASHSEDPKEREEAQKVLDHIGQEEEKEAAKKPMSESQQRAKLFMDSISDNKETRDKANAVLDKIAEQKAKEKPPGAKKEDEKRAAAYTAADRALNRAIKTVENQMNKKGPQVTGFLGEINRYVEFGKDIAGYKTGTQASEFANDIYVLQGTLPKVFGATGQTAKDEREKWKNISAGLARLTAPSAVLNMLKTLRGDMDALKSRASWAVSAEPDTTMKVSGDGAAPPVHLLKKGTVTSFGDKGDWMLDEGGNPKRVK